MSPKSPPLQVLLLANPGAPLVAGLPCFVRTACQAAKELPARRIVIAKIGPARLDRWSFQLANAGVSIANGLDGANALDLRAPLLAIGEDVFPDAGGVADFVASAEPLGSAKKTMLGRTVAVYARNPSSFSAGSKNLADVHARALAAAGVELAAGAFFEARTPASIAAAEKALNSRLGKPNDGYLARLDRRVSLAITRLMLPFSITPNQITAASLLLGLLGAAELAAASASTQLKGALLLWFCALLDGCDGEVARLKHLGTKLGGNFDLFADHISHLATFIALPIGVARLHPGQSWWALGFLLVSGFIACAFLVWRLVLCAPETERGSLSLVVERLASRDYVYLILGFSAIGHIDWFIWAAAIGSHIFWVWLFWASRRSGAKTPSSEEPSSLPPAIEPS